MIIAKIIVVLFIMAVFMIGKIKSDYMEGCKGCGSADYTKGISCDNCIEHCNYVPQEEIDKIIDAERFL